MSVSSHGRMLQHTPAVAVCVCVCGCVKEYVQWEIICLFSWCCRLGKERERERMPSFCFWFSLSLSFCWLDVCFYSVLKATEIGATANVRQKLVMAQKPNDLIVELTILPSLLYKIGNLPHSFPSCSCLRYRNYHSYPLNKYFLFFNRWGQILFLWFHLIVFIYLFSFNLSFNKNKIRNIFVNIYNIFLTIILRVSDVNILSKIIFGFKKSKIIFWFQKKK